MPNDIQLATIDKVDLRSVWENEAIDFTPWLGENLTALGEALGLDLELKAQEAPVGGFSLDVLAHEPNTNRPVIIENQLETTDHDHLGKLITYASGYDANVVVWITREFKDEHRQALDWLNQRSGEDTEFFGVVLEVWKIDDSRPAPHFRVVSAPNDWHKSSVKIRSTGEASPQQERYRAFFQKLIDALREEHSFTGARKAQPQSWFFLVLDTLKECDMVPISSEKERGLKYISITLIRFGTKKFSTCCRTGVKRFNLPLKESSSGIGTGWTIAGHLGFRLSVRAASATTRRPWTKFTNGWSRTFSNSSEYSALTSPNW